MCDFLQAKNKENKQKKPAGKATRTQGPLEAFLCCLLQEGQPVAKLRGHDPLVRKIWELASEEWWDVHIERFPKFCTGTAGIAKLTEPWIVPDTTAHMQYPHTRQMCGGCPAATIATGLSFLVPTGRYVNMMPIYLDFDLPASVLDYLPIIRHCLHNASYKQGDIAYVTIDERETKAGEAQRRPGLHIESPGVLPVFGAGPGECATRPVELTTGRFIPGAEHRWGGGLMMRQEKIEGGIYMVSNVPGTTAVWNCHINNDSGNIIGPHGDIERLRQFLGPPHVLDAGELVWITDRTPHESLPVQPMLNDHGQWVVPRRQYFRLVVGEVSAWYADHSTPNENDIELPSSVRIIRGDKFELYKNVKLRWSYGTAAQTEAAQDLRELRILLQCVGYGHLYERMKAANVCSLYDLLNVPPSALAPPVPWTVHGTPSVRADLYPVPDAVKRVVSEDAVLGYGRYFYEEPWLSVLLRAVETLVYKKRHGKVVGRFTEEAIADVVTMMTITSDLP